MRRCLPHAILALSLFVFAGRAQEPPSPALAGTATPAASTPWTPPPPFDPTVTTLPPNFEGGDFPALFRSLTVLPKGEFETSAQYAARRPSPGPTVHAFHLEVDEPRYDADAGVFRYRFSTEGSLHGRPLTLVTTFPGKLDSYRASNALGATIDVTGSSAHEWGILLPSQAHQIVELAVPVATGRAGEVKPRLRLLAVIRLRPDSAVDVTDPELLHTDSDHKSPTLQSPYDYTTYRHDIPADLLSVWAYDQQTGEVFGRFDLSGQRLERDGSLAPQQLAPAQDVWTIRDRVRRGMTFEEVERLAAPMEARVTKVRGPGKRQEWTYGSWLVVDFADGRVTGVRTTPQGIDVTVAP
jgi:hypothetical protein